MFSHGAGVQNEERSIRIEIHRSRGRHVASIEIDVEARGVSMAEVLVEFDAAFPGTDGAKYAPRACARAADDGRWEGWLEFSDLETGAVIRSGRETTQPTRDDTMYWATG